jgi:hypothetical protein
MPQGWSEPSPRVGECASGIEVSIPSERSKNEPDADLWDRYLYTIFLAIDACFRLKRKKISTWLADPSIQDGWAYFVRSFTYEEFVKTLGEQKEVNLLFTPSQTNAEQP